MTRVTIYSQVESAIDSGDTARVRSILIDHAGFLQGSGYGRDLLSYAARRNNVEMVSLLVELGGDINDPAGESKPEGVIDDAAGTGAIHVVKWLLDHGAKINQEVGGVTRCWPLTGAVVEGHLDVVKLLVVRGA